MPNISQKLAQQRFQYIDQTNLKYFLNLYLRDKQNFDGFLQITLTLKKQPHNNHITLDFTGNPHQVFINNQKASFNYNSQECFLKINSQKIDVGKQTIIAILYQCDYRNDGNAAHLYYENKDSQDQQKPQKPYIYTQFQVNHANGVFPCFDQPDLKARLTLNTIIHKKLVNIISNQTPFVANQPYFADKFKQKSQTKAIHQNLWNQFMQNKQGLMFLFPQTKKLPTYLYGFIAGDYFQIQIQKPYQTLREKRKIDIKIGCIRSLANHFIKMKDFIFEITLNAFRFYEQYFGIDYVFDKFDQFYCPQFNAGAMQNAGIVTYNDDYIWRVDPSEVTQSDKVDLANTITHELSHHWFGNLVTMKWWNDLWLNQSFADFISYYCLQRIKDNGLKTVKYQSAMIDYFYRKEGGYRDDSIEKTTHPIRGQVIDTVAADNIFDGITYCKGGSVLRQLQFCTNQENFSKALSDYFNDPKYQFSNGTFDDFLEKIRPYFEKQNKAVDFNEWKKVWFSLSSFNVIQPIWNPHDFSKQCDLTIVQKYYSQGFKTLRPHKIKVAFLLQNGSYDLKQVLLNSQDQEGQSRTVIKYDGSKGYRAILLNQGDYSFVKVGFDSTSFDFFKNNLSKINNILARALIWKTLFQMVKDGQIKCQQYLNDFVLKYISNQKQISIIDYIFQMNIPTGINSYVPIPYREALSRKMFYFMIYLLATIDEKQLSRIAVYRKNIKRYTKGDDVIESLLSWKQRSFPPLKKYQINMDEEWATVTKMFCLKNLSLQEKWKIFQETAKKDQTKQPQLRKMRIQTFLIDEQDKLLEKYEIFKTDFTNPKNSEKFGREYSVRQKEIISEGFASQNHLKFLEKKQFKDRYFNDFIELAKITQGQHFFTFFLIRPIDDNLDDIIERFQKINLDGAKFKKILTRRDKLVDSLVKRKKAYKLYE